MSSPSRPGNSSRRVCLAFDALEARLTPAAANALAVIDAAAIIDVAAAQALSLSARINSPDAQSILPIANANAAAIGFFHTLCRNGGAGNDYLETPVAPPLPRPIVPPTEAGTEPTPRQAPTAPVAAPAASAPAETPAAAVPIRPTQPIHVDNVLPRVEPPSEPLQRTDSASPELPPPHPSPALAALSGVFLFGLMPPEPSSKRRGTLK